MDAQITLGHSLIAVEAEHSLDVLLDLSAPVGLDGSTRRPVSLALVIDRSGSMAGGRLETVTHAARWLLTQLGPDDQVAVVSFDDTVSLDAPLGVALDVADKALGALEPGGMTDLSGGWLKAREQLAHVEGIRRILLLTDGQANQGITDGGRLASLVGQAATQGISTSLLGVGEGFNEDLLGVLADAAGGEYHYLASVDDAAPAFSAELGDLVSLFAQNVSVEIRPKNGVAALGVLNEYPSVPVDGGVQVQLGNTYVGQTRSAVLRLGVPQMASLGPAVIADLVLRYDVVDPVVASHEVTLPVVINVVDAKDAAAQIPDARVVTEVEELEVATVIRRARDAADHGDSGTASELFGEAADRLGGMPIPEHRQAEVGETIEELRRLSATTADLNWDTQTSKSAHDRMRRSQRRRA